MGSPFQSQVLSTVRPCGTTSLTVRAGACCFVLASLAVQAAVAQEPRLTVLPVSHTLTIAGLVEDKPIEMQGTFWVNLEGWPEGQNPPTLSLGLSEDLAAKGGAGRPDVRLTNLALRPDGVLENGKSVRVEVTIKDVQWPGLYSGKISYSVQGDKALMTEFETAQKQTTAETERERVNNLKIASEGWKGEVVLTLDVRTKPRVVATETELTMNLVDCTWFCGLARLFLPDETTPGPWPVEIHNGSLTPVVITPRARISRKENLSIEDGFSFVRPENEQETAAGTQPDGAIGGTYIAIADDGIFNFSVDRSTIGPGTYEGSLLFKARPSGEDALPGQGPDGAPLELNRTDVSVKARVDVRAGVFWVLFWILAGIIAGRMNRQISTPEAQARLKLYDKTVTLRDRIQKLVDSTSKQFLGDRLVEIRQGIEDLDRPDEEIRQALDRLEKQVRLAEDLESLYDEVNHLNAVGIADPSTLADITTEILSALRKVLGGDAKELEEVKETLKSIRNAILSAKKGGAAATVEALITTKDAPPPSVAPPPPSVAPPAAKIAAPRWPRLVKLLAVLAGTRNLSVETRYWYLQPAATVFLLFALTVYGVFLLYTGPGNSTFGANGIADYVPLFLWGFGSDVVTKRLGDISFAGS